MEGILPSKYPQANDQNQLIPSKFAFQDLTFLNASFLLCNQTNYHSLSLSRGARKINSFKSYHLTTIHSPKQRLTSSAVEPPQLDSYSLGWMDCIHQVLVISLPPENRLFFFSQPLPGCTFRASCCHFPPLCLSKKSPLIIQG